MPRRSKTLHKEFEKKVKGLEKNRKKFENAFDNRFLDFDDIHQAYAGLYLDLFTEFELLIENLFLGLLEGGVKHINPLISIKVQIRPKSEVGTILRSGKSYLDWLPYPDNTIKRARIYFNNGAPFTFLQDSQKNYLNDFHIIRNAIAHKSTHSLNKFNELIRGKTLLPHEQTPRGYLRTIPVASSGQRYLELASLELLSMSNIICS